MDHERWLDERCPLFLQHTGLSREKIKRKLKRVDYNGRERGKLHTNIFFFSCLVYKMLLYFKSFSRLKQCQKHFCHFFFKCTITVSIKLLSADMGVNGDPGGPRNYWSTRVRRKRRHKRRQRRAWQ